MKCSEQTLHATMGQIASYLARHPAAADSVPGIQRWWMREAELEQQWVEQALEALVEEGLVTRTVLPDGTAVFSATGRHLPSEHDRHR